MRPLHAATLVLIAVGTLGSTALAQTTPDTETEEVPAARKAFELGLSGGYTQPFGGLGTGSIHDFVSAGGAIDLQIGYRFTPHWSIEGTSQFHYSSGGSVYDGQDSKAEGLTMGISGTYHFRPDKRLDPYASLGAGYRLLWLMPESQTDDFVHGFQLARAVVDLDYRANAWFAVGPMIGADLSLFMWNNPEGLASSRRIDEVRPSTFLFAGVTGRFDIGGPRGQEVAGSDEVEMPTPAAGPPPDRPVTMTGIVVEKNIMELCKIDGPKAFFAFDSSDLRSTDLATLEAVVECFKTGPLKDKPLTIVGRTDPRGTDEYNQKLGKSRAESVLEYLGNRGVPTSTMSVTSRGEEEATGVDENGWAYDRRVDIRLQP